MAKDKEIAKFLLSPAGIRKSLFQINFLIVGRRDSEFNSHKALLFMVMDKNKNRLCSEAYKNDITRTYRQLMLLQLQGYMLWSNAYGILNRDSTVISESYTEVLKKQKTYLTGATCAVNLTNSKNMHFCTGGYYIHKSMKIETNTTCNDGYFSKGEKTLFILSSITIIFRVYMPSNFVRWTIFCHNWHCEYSYFEQFFYNAWD